MNTIKLLRYLFHETADIPEGHGAIVSVCHEVMQNTSIYDEQYN